MIPLYVREIARLLDEEAAVDAGMERGSVDDCKNRGTQYSLRSHNSERVVD